ncbi:hypothetical protein D9M68_103560 [compost metagenome]
MMNAFEFEHLFTYSATLKEAEIMGEVPEGFRINYWVTGGEVQGPKLNGNVLPVGADWLTIRRDGMAALDVRLSIHTEDGGLIDVTYPGLGDLGPNGYEAIVRGESPARMTLRTSPRFRTAHPDYQWLHRHLCVGIGEVDFERAEVVYDVYALR